MIRRTPLPYSDGHLRDHWSLCGWLWLEQFIKEDTTLFLYICVGVQASSPLVTAFRAWGALATASRTWLPPIQAQLVHSNRGAQVRFWSPCKLQYRLFAFVIILPPLCPPYTNEPAVATVVVCSLIYPEEDEPCAVHRQRVEVHSAWGSQRYFGVLKPLCDIIAGILASCPRDLHIFML